MPDDGALVRRVLDGDDASFALLFRRHAAAVHAYAQRRTRSADLADDITANAFEKAWRGLDQLGARHGDRFRPWLFRIAANEMATLMRSRSRRRHREHLAAVRGDVSVEGATASRDVLAAIDAEADAQAVLDALGRLPERYEAVISLRYLSELTAAETATAMGISRGNVAVLLHRAMAALRRDLATEGER